ncbi:unnamed protein product [Cuscuta campestris]|uniref:Uncharacterized protein n=1 Tax=Cuscuta campestris TaxID=132261 RepID=A0A484MRI5_9ASTE|nr:unnamed protein product [Cuscuta campestris]
MNFRSFTIPKKTGASSSAGPHTSSVRTVPVRHETVEIHSEEETPQTGEATQTGKTEANPPPNKGEGKTRTKKAATSHPAAKKRKGENAPAIESLEELWVKMGQKLKEVILVRCARLAHNRELQDLTARQLDEIANLSAIAGRANAEILQLKEQNTQLMGEVSHLKEEVKLKEEELRGRAKQWVEENLVEAARVLTSSEERTMEGFKLLYREEHGKEMITQIDSYGFMSGQKRDREATHEILANRDPNFNAESYGLAPIPD